jgi:hypothetical protein
MSLIKYILNEVTIGKPVLYHFTNPHSAINIIDNDALKIRYTAEDAISLTRNFEPKIKFKSPYSFSVRFALDWNRLKDFYKIVPFLDGHRAYTSNPRDITKWYPTERYDFNKKREKYDEEMEERIEKDITNLHRFIIQIDIFVESIRNRLGNDSLITDSLIPLTKDNPKYSNIPVNIIDKWRPVKV